MGDMPIGLILNGDKSHYDTHGGLCMTPLSFTLSIFNLAARNNRKFWRPLAYLPNLDQNILDESETNTTQGVDPMASEDSIRDEHRCLPIALEPLRNIHRNNGFTTAVFGRRVNVRVWIHIVSTSRECTVFFQGGRFTKG